MSLLNEVLRDIDLRRRDSKEQEILTSILVSEDTKKMDWTGPILILAVVLVFGSITYWLVNYQQDSLRLVSTFELPVVSSQISSDIFASSAANVSQIKSSEPLVFEENSPRTAGITLVDTSGQLSAEAREAAQDNSGVPSEKSVITQKQPPNAQLYGTLEAAVLAYNYKDVSMQDFYAVVMKLIPETEPLAIEMALQEVEYVNRSRDQLLSLLELNRKVSQIKLIDRTDAYHQIYSQLRLKSTDAGYWSFQQAVLYDKQSELRNAYYLYQQALQTDDITSKQRELSRLRIEQLQFQFR